MNKSAKEKAPGAPASAPARSPVRHAVIDREQAGQRIDNFLRREMPGLPKGRLYRILRRGEVRVNGGRVRAEYRLREGDKVRIPPAHVAPDPSAPPRAKVADIERHILFEDKRVIVINKPGGLAVHGGSGLSFGAIELLRAARPTLRDLSLAHRLDRETSGCLVFAKKRSALRELHEYFRTGNVDKNYLALVAGDWQHGEIEIDAPLAVENRKSGERHVLVSRDGKPAATGFALSRSFGRFSLVRCHPRTGRTHQIRVHALQAGHPVVGDERYGDPEVNQAAAELGLRRLFLHAQSISFPDEHGNEQHFSAPLTDDLQQFLETLEAGAPLRRGRRRRSNQDTR